MKLVLIKFILPIVLVVFIAGCAGEPLLQANTHADSHIVQGGAVAAEGMIYIPLGIPNDKK